MIQSSSLESARNYPDRIYSQQPPHRRTISGLTDPFVSKPNDTRIATPLTMKLQEAARKDSNPPTNYNSDVSPTVIRKRWQEPQAALAPPRPRGDEDDVEKARREALTKQIEDLQRALANFDAEADERKKRTEKETLEHLRQFGLQNKGRDTASSDGSDKDKTHRMRRLVEVLHDGHNLDLYDESNSDLENLACTNHDEEIPISSTVTEDNEKPQSKAKTHQTPPHLSPKTNSPETNVEDSEDEAALPPHLRTLAIANHQRHPMTITQDLSCMELAALAEEGPSPTFPPHLQFQRNVTDPSKIVHIKETPPAPHRRPHNNDARPNSTSPTPRRHGITRTASPSSDDGELVSPPPPVTKNEVFIGTARIAPDTANSAETNIEEPIPIGSNRKIGAGTIATRKGVHVVNSVGMEITTSQYALPEGHSVPWVRNAGRPVKISEPPAAFLLRTLVPVSYKDSALSAKERADAFNQRLTDIEKMTGLSGRYPNESYYARRLRGGRPDPVRDGFGRRQNANTSRGPWDSFSMHSANHNRPAGNRRKLPHKEDSALVEAVERFSPLLPETSITKAEHELLETPSTITLNIRPPTPPLDIVTERRTILIEEIPQVVTLAYILRALGNTGRIEEITLDENYKGQYAIIRFIEEETAALFADRKHLVVPISRNHSEILSITYQPANEILRSEATVLAKDLSRIVVVGPCPEDYFVNAYLDLMGDDATMKPGLVEYIWEMVNAMNGTWPNHTLDISLATKGKLIQAIISFSSIKAAIEVAETARTVPSFQAVKVSFGQDPCQGPEEHARLASRAEKEDEEKRMLQHKEIMDKQLKENENQLKENEKGIVDERKKAKYKVDYSKIPKVMEKTQGSGSYWMDRDETDVLRAYEEALKQETMKQETPKAGVHL